MNKNFVIGAVLSLMLLLSACVGVGSSEKNNNSNTDTTPPTIVLVGDSSMNLTIGDTFVDPGVTVSDNVDSNLTATKQGTVDTSKTGTYTITYTASDSAGNVATQTRTVTVAASAIVGDAYIFHSAHDDSYYMEFWGDVWDSQTTYTDKPTDTTYSKALELNKSAGWGTLVAWGNRPNNAVNTSAYTHARFKVSAPGYTQVQVFVQGNNEVGHDVVYDLSKATDLGNGWGEMEVRIPGMAEMTWFALNFIGGSGKVLLADVYFTTQDVVITPPPTAAPVPTANDADVIVLYSDTLNQDSWISVWESNWWNAPIHDEGNIAGDHFAKYEITDGGIAGGVVGLEFGFETAPLNASTKTTWNFDMYVETGITTIALQLVTTDGSGTYRIDNPAAGSWNSFAIPFSSITPNSGNDVINAGSLLAIGIQMWGQSGQAIYLDNIYFSGNATFHNLNVTVQDNVGGLISGATVTAGGVTGTSAANGIATLSVPTGNHKVVVDANGFGVGVGIQAVNAATSYTMTLQPMNPGPTVAAPVPPHSDAEAIVLYSDQLVVDQYISYWSDDWWNAPTFSEVQIQGNSAGRLQIIPGGVAGGITGIQYGIAQGPLDASSATRIRFDMYATSGITKIFLQVLSSTGPGRYEMNTVTTGQWITVDLAFSSLIDSQKITSSALTQLGVQLWGTTSDALYLDNIYFY